MKFLEAAKAYVALVGTIATALLAEVGGTAGHVLVLVSIVATAIVTYKVPNKNEYA